MKNNTIQPETPNREWDDSLGQHDNRVPFLHNDEGPTAGSDETKNGVETFDISQDRKKNNECCTKGTKIIVSIMACCIVMGAIAGGLAYMKAQQKVKKEPSSSPVTIDNATIIAVTTSTPGQDERSTSIIVDHTTNHLQNTTDTDNTAQQGKVCYENKCCNGYLEVCTLNYFCKPSIYWENNWPSEFIAIVKDSIVAIGDQAKLPACCFKITSKVEVNSITIQPEAAEFYEFEDENPTVTKCVCDNCS